MKGSRTGAVTNKAAASVLKPLLEIVGDRRLLIENHKGVVQYETNFILVKVSFGYIEICGSELMISCMSKDKMVITGKLESVRLQKGC